VKIYYLTTVLIIYFVRSTPFNVFTSNTHLSKIGEKRKTFYAATHGSTILLDLTVSLLTQSQYLSPDLNCYFVAKIYRADFAILHWCDYSQRATGDRQLSGMVVEFFRRRVISLFFLNILYVAVISFPLSRKMKDALFKRSCRWRCFHSIISQ